MIDLAKARRNMVDGQVRPFGVVDHAVLAAMDAVERERFAPEAALPVVYLDLSLDVGEGRAMLTPMTLARLLQELRLQKSDRVIDLACGLGYSTAVIAQIAGEAIGVESNPALAAEAARRLAAANVKNAAVLHGALDKPPTGGKPADAILVNGAVETIPDGWLDAVVEGGRIACIRGFGTGRAVLLTRVGGGFSERALFDAGAPALPDLRKAPAFAF